VRGPAGTTTIAMAPVLRLASLFMVRDAVRLDAGAAQMPLLLLTHDLAAGTLVNWARSMHPRLRYGF
jgi:DNA-binding transcriptional LysR family regulator